MSERIQASASYGLSLEPPVISGRCRDCGEEYEKVLCPTRGVEMRISGPVQTYTRTGVRVVLDQPVYVEHACQLTKSQL
jgi:hypothetical protein